MEEMVRVLDRDAIVNRYGIDETGVIRVSEDDIIGLAERTAGVLERSAAETDEGKKQIIAYCMLVSGEHVFMTRRTQKQGETRLHNMYSLGIGGHINADDATVRSGMLRELHEEVCIAREPSYRFFGIINEDSNAVSRVHVGICYIVEVENFACSIREKDKMEGSWVPVGEVEKYYDRMESWSKLLFTTYLESFRSPNG